MSSLNPTTDGRVDPGTPDVDRTVKFYRIPPSQRAAYVAPMLGHQVAGEYRQGPARVKLAGRFLTTAFDPVRRLLTLVIDQPGDRTIVINLSSVYDIHTVPGDSA